MNNEHMELLPEIISNSQIAFLNGKLQEAFSLAIKRDNSASSAVAEAKKEFYKQDDYLKPECEKSDWEKFCDKQSHRCN